MNSKFIRGLGIFITITGVLMGLALSIFVAHEIAGGWGVVLGILIFPLTFAYLPLYALFFYGSWNLLLVNYGSVAVGWIFLSVAENMKKPQPQLATDEPPTQPVVTTDYPSLAIIIFVVGGLILAAIIFALSHS
jgi:hypothetical protein